MVTVDAPRTRVQKRAKNGIRSQKPPMQITIGNGRRSVGAASPRAMAELRAGRSIDWANEDEPKLLEQLLGMPAEKLVDPKYGSPIYSGVPLDFGHYRCPAEVSAATDIRKVFAQMPQAREFVDRGLVSENILHQQPTNLRLFAAQAADRLADELQSMDGGCSQVASAAEATRFSELSVANRIAELSDATFVEAGRPLGRLDRKFLILPPEWLHVSFSDLKFGIPGEYFVDAPTATSPVQGPLADCWLIAAMAAVSWTTPQTLGERVRREAPQGDVDTGKADFLFDFTDVLKITIPPFINVSIPFTFQQWVGAEVPETSYGGLMYASSSVAGETWPAVVEKAAAVWRSGGDADFPDSTDYGHLNGGDPAWACHILTGGTAWYHWADADDTFSTIKSYCTGNRTHSPLVAWTWGSSDDSPNKVDYAGANLVANHAYTILGIWETNNRQYVVLRNPWGYFEGTLNVHAGAWTTSESWGAATLNLPGSGVFALEIHTFRVYFMGFGGA